MLIIPALYLSHGNCVSLYKGKKEQTTILSKNPLQAAKIFEKKGATRIHLVDLDDNCSIVKIITKNTTLSVQYAGHISKLSEIDELFGFGAAMVSLNQFSESFLSDALEKYGPSKILFTIRAQRNVVEGKPGLDVVDYGKDIASRGVSNIIFRDEKAEGTLHPNFDEVDRLILGTGANIFAFGGIGRTSDLRILKKTGAYGAIISRALFENELDLKECIERFT